MGSGDLSTDLNLGMLTPATSVRPSNGQSDRQDAESKTRRQTHPRQTHPEEENSEPQEKEEENESDDKPAHQLDRMA
jgi:hypothetical protein